jgi:spermidine synthase
VFVPKFMAFHKQNREQNANGNRKLRQARRSCHQNLPLTLISRYYVHMQSRRRGWIVLGLFFCSGASALIYEVLWSKFLSEMFGSTSYAQTVVLAAFMGGLAIGNRWFGRWSDTLKNPLAAYGILEIAIGIYAFLFPWLDRGVNGLFVLLGTPLVNHNGWLLALKGFLSALLLLGPTILMGGTLPLLAAWLQRYYTDPGRRSARFYSVNSLGAVLGAALAGFWLVQTFGMILTLQIAAVTNLVIGILALWLGREGLATAISESERAAAGPEPQIVGTGTLRRAGLMVALTGGVSMGLEVVASRCSGLIFGPSLQSFAAVLIAFILGIGLGSAWIAAPQRGKQASERMVVIFLCLAAAWVAILVFRIESWVEFYRWARTGLARTMVGYIYYELFNAGAAVVVLGIPAALIGAVLPLMMRAVSASATPLGSKVGSLLTWNTLGAVTGTLLTGFVLMPQAGLRHAFALLALVLGLVALVVAWRRTWTMGIAGAMVACGLTLCVFAFGNEDWQTIISSGAFRTQELTYAKDLVAMWKKHIKLVFYEDAPDATVSVDRADGLVTPAILSLRINGKADASTGIDVDTQILFAHLPMLVRPGAKDAFVLGIGAGTTVGTLLAYPLDNIDVAENCEPVIRAAKLFADWNHHMEDDPRVHIWYEDARTVLKLRPHQYDVIITEPSNPWTIGVGSVFSREYYELAARRLKPGGIVCQWFHTYEMQDDILALILRTFGSVFPYMEIWDIGDGDLIILGSQQPWQTGPDVFRQSFAIDRVREDMWMMNIQSPEALMAKQLASQQTAFAIAGPGRLQSDWFPVLEYEAPRAFYMNGVSFLLDRYDERTYQQLLAPPAKLSVLSNLPPEAVQVVFSPSATDNKELWGCIFGMTTGINIPCIFRTPLTAPAPASAGTMLDQAERAFAAGNLVEARQWVAQALKQQPDDRMAGYVSRVIERAEEMRAANNTTQASRQFLPGNE